MLRKIFEKLYFKLNSLHSFFKDFWLLLISKLLSCIILYIFLSLCSSYKWFSFINDDDNFHLIFGLIFFIWFFCFYTIIFYELWIENNLYFFFYVSLCF